MESKGMSGLVAIVMGLALGLVGCASSGEKTPKANTQVARAGLSKAGACVSNQHCPGGFYCSTEDGVCETGPNCGRKQSCARLCYGSCRPQLRAGTSLTVR